MEGRDTTKNKLESWEKKLTTQGQPCKHFRRAGHKYVHKYIKEEKFFMNPNKKGDRPPWATKKLKISTFKSKPTNDGAWDILNESTHCVNIQ